MDNGLHFLDARVRELKDAVALLSRNIDQQEWRALDSNLQYIAAKAQTAQTRLHAMQLAWVAEMDQA